MLGDLGKTFGKANLFNKDNPGAVNLKAWSETEIWRGDARVRGQYGSVVHRVRSIGRRSAKKGGDFSTELLMQLSDQQIRDLFEVSQFTRRDKTSTVDDWVRVFKQKRDEIANRRCTTSGRLGHRLPPGAGDLRNNVGDADVVGHLRRTGTDRPRASSSRPFPSHLNRRRRAGRDRSC